MHCIFVRLKLELESIEKIHNAMIMLDHFSNGEPTYVGASQYSVVC